ncbi:COP9 signalosome complex subunit 7a-like [Corticium candelabrum]|uniref:COP9 signalosome complex subunit 7a-like n=1 Tax=Corticium candelabrum TaxID=121492 RepID=UPI002E276B0B|nr:COP9 signalosome complex subunit 7a-like [Corticium candelabrum]
MAAGGSDNAAPSTHQPLEQFVLLAKSAKGAAVVALITQALEAPGVYVFGELLDMPNVQELADTEFSHHLELLKVFAYGTVADYKACQPQLPAVTPLQLVKLRHLTIVSLAAKSKVIPYETLLRELAIDSLRELEDLIIEATYADIIRGKLDQKNHRLEVDYAIGRDVRAEEIGGLVDVLRSWCDGCETVLGSIEFQIQHANTLRKESLMTKQKVETEVENLKKTLVASADLADGQSNTQQFQQASAPAKKSARGSSKLLGAVKKSN